MLPATCYDNRLLNLGLERLETRRMICDIAETFKLCEGFSCLKMSDYVSLATYKSTRGHSNKLFVNYKHSRVHGHFLFNVLNFQCNALGLVLKFYLIIIL